MELGADFHPLPNGVTVSCESYTIMFPVCYRSPCNVFTASSGFISLYALCFEEKQKRVPVVAEATVHKQDVYSGSRLLEDLNFQSVSGLYKNFTRISLSEFKFLIILIREKISKKTASRKAISVQKGFH